MIDMDKDRRVELAEHMQNIIDTDLLALEAVASKFGVHFNDLLAVQIKSLTAGLRNESDADSGN